MKHRIFFSLALFSAVLLSGCYDEGKLTPSPEPEPVTRIPQGNHDYDNNIVALHDKYKVELLYKFEPRDVYWQINQWIGPDSPTASHRTLEAIQAEEEYVKPIVDFMENQFFAFYPDTLLQRCLPLRFFLCSALNKINSSAVVTAKHNCILKSGTSYIAVNHANAEFASMSVADKNTFKKDLHIALRDYIHDKGFILQSDAFLSISDYTSVTAALMYSKGLLSTASSNRDNDWKAYLEAAMSFTYDELMAAETSTATHKGILNPIKDVNGLIRIKYDIITQYYRDNFNLDLQAIGNAKIMQ